MTPRNALLIRHTPDGWKVYAPDCQPITKGLSTFAAAITARERIMKAK